MKLVLLLSLFATPAFAYGPHFATGKAVICALRLEGKPVYCQPHVVSETKPEPVLVDAGGNRYTTVNQQIDNAECGTASVYGRFDTLAVDTSQPFAQPLVNLNAPNISVWPRENDEDRRQVRKGVIYYINRSFTPAAEASAKAAALAVMTPLLQNLKVAYAPSTHTFAFQGDNLNRRVYADLSAGRSTREPDYTAHVTISSFSANGLSYETDLSCGSESARQAPAQQPTPQPTPQPAPQPTPQPNQPAKTP